ncbi:aryl hydrocarbon receptor-like [Pholidichthys leucotaenia]
MLATSGTYANKKRKKPILKPKRVSDNNVMVKSNPSKRHRDRLNGELDRLMELLPFPEEVRSRLDKLSVLRLSVGYLRVKSYFRATMKGSSSSGGGGLVFSKVNGQNGPSSMDAAILSEGDLLLQALNGFVLVVTAEGLVFYASPTIKDYLGFHQSDVVHQSVFELIHTDDRAVFREQLHFALNPEPLGADDNAMRGCGNTVVYNMEDLPPENSSFLERTFVCRFRCLLDNSSGFLALKFQGRLKYLHGQNLMRDNSTCNAMPPQLTLFAIAMPVQPPSIVEIRAKMLLFQTRHKMDFTPMGVDSRGKIILGYSETELCMKGSGYQFIHAADMMYCADNHIHMLKTGETGLTVFRLLSKSRKWLWVKSNAKVIFKGGRPEFIIAFQRAISNEEGEEYLRQRRLQLPFSFTTGEATLYNTGPTLDRPHFQSNKTFSSGNIKKDVVPGSLLDCFLTQEDEGVYTPTAAEAPLPMDEVFMNSRALVSVASDAWQGNEATAATGQPAIVKEEAKQSVMAVIGSLQDMAQGGEFGTALWGTEVDPAEVMEWENVLKRMSQDGEEQTSIRTDLDGIVANEIFDYIDAVLFKESGGDCQEEPLSEPLPPLFHNISAPLNGLYPHQQQGTANGGQSAVFGSGGGGGTQKLCHPSLHHPDPALPALQQLQLDDIFSPSIELPKLTVANITADNVLDDFQASVGHVSHPQLPQTNHSQSQLPTVMDVFPPLVPCGNFSSPSAAHVPIHFPPPCLHRSLPFDPHGLPLQQWNHAGVTHNTHGMMPAFQSQNSQTFPHTGRLPRNVSGLSPHQQGALQSSCMFEQPSVPQHSALRSTDASLDHRGSAQSSCFFQRNHSEPVMGQEDGGTDAVTRCTQHPELHGERPEQEQPKLC